MKGVNLICGDALEELKKIPDESFDLILTDMPYGTTKNKWDTQPMLHLLWPEFFRVTKRNANIVLFSSGMFTAKLILSNEKYFRYKIVWNKVNKISGHLNAKKQPLRIHEDICVFYRKLGTYNPQMIKGKPYKSISSGNKSSNYGNQVDGVITENTGLYYPRDIVEFSADKRNVVGRLHPTQKPVSICEYLINTYSNPGDRVLDCFAGSGTTGIAAKKSGRSCTLIEKDAGYCEIIKERIRNEKY